MMNIGRKLNHIRPLQTTTYRQSWLKCASTHQIRVQALPRCRTMRQAVQQDTAPISRQTGRELMQPVVRPIIGRTRIVPPIMPLARPSTVMLLLMPSTIMNKYSPVSSPHPNRSMRLQQQSLVQFINIYMKRFSTAISKFAFSDTKIPLSLGYPFEYSLMPEEFALHDIRFTQLPFNRELAHPQKQHLHLVLTHFQKILNGQKMHSNELDREFIRGCLKDKTNEMRQILTESHIDLKFKFNLDTVCSTKGYFEIKPQPNVSLHEKDLHQIHEYHFHREKQILNVGLRLRKQEMTQQEMLKKDIEQGRNETGKQIRENFQEMAKKKKTIADRMMDRLMKLGKTSKQRTQFQPYYVVEQITGTMACTMTHQSQPYEDQEVPFDSKWLYFINNLESEDLKRHRKRALFDFQFWNRGSFFPIHNFAADLSALD